jgi:hypothetical protein
VTVVAVTAAIALTASPTRVRLNGAGGATIDLVNRGRQAFALDASRAGFTLDLRGRPRVVAAAHPGWLSVSPRRVRLAPGGSARVAVTARVPRGLAPGDHAAVLLLSMRRVGGAGIAVRVRLGVLVVLRVPGRIVHRLTVEAVRVRGPSGRRVLMVRLANRGNVTEALARARFTVELRRGKRLLGRLHGPRTEILPHGRALVELPCRTPLHGLVTTRVAWPGGARTFRLRFR